MKARAQKGFSMLFPEISSETANCIVNLCNAKILSELVDGFEKKTSKVFPVKSQFGETKSDTNDINSQFKF